MGIPNNGLETNSRENYRISHVLREGNFLAHILANAYDLANVGIGKEIDGGFNLAYDKEIDVDKTIDLMSRTFSRAYESFLKDYNRQVFYRLHRMDRRVAPLIRADTVSTMADQTLRAFIDHGMVSMRIDSNVSEVEGIYSALEKLGIDWGSELELDRVDSFKKGFDSFLYSLQEKAKSLKFASLFVGNIDSQVTETLLAKVFSSIGPIEGCKLVRKEKSSYGFIHYLD